MVYDCMQENQRERRKRERKEEKSYSFYLFEKTEKMRGNARKEKQGERRGNSCD